MRYKVTLFVFALVGAVLAASSVACSDSACSQITSEIAACPENNMAASTTTGDDGSQTSCVEAQAQCQIDSAIDPCKFTFHPEELNQAEQDKLAICN